MDVRNCKRCGKVFTYRGMNLCNECFEKEQVDFQKVKDYLEENPGATLMEVSLNTGIDLRTINRFLREGRLEAEGVILNDSDITCEQCGKPIGSGRYCEDCLRKLQNELKEAAARLEKNKQLEGRRQIRIHTCDSIQNDDD